MAEPKVWTFFYGSYMNPAVLAETGIRPDRFVVARLPGYEVRIEPRAAEAAYVDRILAPARQFGFPAEYIARLETFRPRG